MPPAVVRKCCAFAPMRTPESRLARHGEKDRQEVSRSGLPRQGSHAARCGARSGPGRRRREVIAFRFSFSITKGGPSVRLLFYEPPGKECFHRSSASVGSLQDKLLPKLPLFRTSIAFLVIRRREFPRMTPVGVYYLDLTARDRSCPSRIGENSENVLLILLFAGGRERQPDSRSVMPRGRLPDY